MGYDHILANGILDTHWTRIRPVDPFRIAYDLGWRVVSTNKVGSFDADAKMQSLYVNSDLHGANMREACARALGKGLGAHDIDTFAAFLLVPDTSLGFLSDAHQSARQFFVTPDLIDTRRQVLSQGG